MKPTHALLIAAAVAVAAFLGLLAATRTTQLGAASSQPKVAASEIARRSQALDRVQSELAAQARRKPPALPAIPRATPNPVGSAPGSAVGSSQTVVAAPAPRVVYVRPKPIVHIVHRHGGHEDEGEGGGTGGELDD